MFIILFQILFFSNKTDLWLCLAFFAAHGLPLASVEQWLLFVAVGGLPIAVASLVAGTQASVTVAHRCSCLAACGILPDQGSNLSIALAGGF